MTELASSPKVTFIDQDRRRFVEQDLREQVAVAAGQAQSYTVPVLVMSEQRLRDNVRRFMAAMPRVQPHFAVKANPDSAILTIFAEEGACFEIASSAELDALTEMNVPVEHILYSNPIKSPKAVRDAAAAGIEWYSVDCSEEVAKIAAVDPTAKLYIRIEVSNEGSTWPLAGKFGASATGVDRIIETAQRLQMNVCGVTFHVGSQCTNVNNWVEGINSAKGIFDKLRAHGYTPELLNLGGGYPLQLTGSEPTIEEIGAVISEQLESIPSTIKVVAEPGSYFVGSAGCLITQVVGLATRDNARWLYLDTGFYGGLMELAQNFPLTLVSRRTGAAESWAMAGPTCDSIDVLGTHQLPANMEVEDLIFMPNLGAYCTSCACDFNGFPAPALVMAS